MSGQDQKTQTETARENAACCRSTKKKKQEVVEKVADTTVERNVEEHKEAPTGKQDGKGCCCGN